MFTEKLGCTNFRRSTLDRHITNSDHRNSVDEIVMRKTFNTTVSRALSDADKAIISAMQSVYWLAKEDIATLKYESLLKFLKFQGVDTLDTLKISQNATYTSRETADGMQDAIGSIIKKQIVSQLRQSEFISVLSDESTDVSVVKKLVMYMYVRVIDDDFTPRTCYFGNVKVKDGTAATIATTLKAHVLNDKLVVPEQFIGFGSDGASVMTGKNNGVCVRLRREINPFLLGIHCIAYRLALCTSQAAEKVPYLKKYQQSLTDIYYHFSRSAVRTETLKSIQVILNDPCLKYKEVHEVRWFSFYSALETIYRTYGSLVTYFEAQTEKLPTAKGLAKTMRQYEFVATTHLLMDVIPILTHLSMVFQASDIDIAIVQASLQTTTTQLEGLATDNGKFLSDLEKMKETDNKYVVSGHYIKTTPNAVKRFANIRRDFIQNILDNLSERFPRQSTELINAFAVLAMRPLSFLSKDELTEYGNQEIGVLVNHFGEAKTRGDDTVVDRIVDPACVMREWATAKELVLSQLYPRDKMAILWKLMYTYHRDQFPNLLKLAKIALILPIQTADCERGFSVQNKIKTNIRNRFEPDRLDVLSLISAEGPPIDMFPFEEALKEWKTIPYVRAHDVFATVFTETVVKEVVAEIAP
ncbi:zinc finger protein 862-like [Glandiceps talaboti]